LEYPASPCIVRYPTVIVVGGGGAMGVCLGVCMLCTEYDEGVYWVVMGTGLLCMH